MSSLIISCVRWDAVCEKTAICPETNVDTIRVVFLRLTEHDAEEDGEQGREQDAPLLDVMLPGDVTECASRERACWPQIPHFNHRNLDW